MNPWGTLNDWQRFEVDERVRRYGSARRVPRASRLPRPTAAPEKQPATALSRDDVTACA